MAEASRPTQPIEIFYSYAHEDEQLRDQLEKHLKLLQRQGVISGWHDRQIGAGEEWAGLIDEHLDSAGVILLLISADFLASDYCYDIEMTRALERHQRREARVIPVILRPCDWQKSPFGKLQALPKDAKPVTSWADRDEAFLSVAQGIRQVVEKFSSTPIPRQTPPISDTRPEMGTPEPTKIAATASVVGDRKIDPVRQWLHERGITGRSSGTTIPLRELLVELSDLFDRLSFSESIYECDDMDWGSRFCALCLTSQVLEDYWPLVRRKVGSGEDELIRSYKQVSDAVRSYADAMTQFFRPRLLLADAREQCLTDHKGFMNSLRENALSRDQIPQKILDECEEKRMLVVRESDSWLFPAQPQPAGAGRERKTAGVMGPLHVADQNDLTRKILVLAANPEDATRLRLDEEVREIGEGLRRAGKRDQFTLAQRGAVRIRDIRRAMLDEEPQVVHFCGHGETEGLVFESPAGQSQVVDVEALSELFELFSDKVECVVLNACYSAPQAEAISRHIPFVIGMKKQIGDRAAVEFAVGFYDGLGAGWTVEKAYRLGCNAVRMEGIPEHQTPVLHRRGSATTPAESSLNPH